MSNRTTPIRFVPPSECNAIYNNFLTKAMGTKGNIKLQEAYDYNTCDYKIGQESIYDLNQIAILSKIGISPARQTITDKSKPNRKPLADQVLVSTGAFATKLIDTKVKNKLDKSEPYSLSAGNVLKALNIFLDVDFKGEALDMYHADMRTIHATNVVSNWLTTKIKEEVEFLKSKKGLGQAPNVISFSKNGLHFHWHIDLKCGWSEEGIQYLSELDQKTLQAFKDAVGINDLSELQPQFFTDERKERGIQTVLDNFFKGDGVKRGYDDKAKDIGSRKTREIGMWHTKKADDHWLMRPYEAKDLLSTTPLVINLPELTKKEAKAMKEEFETKIAEGKILYKYLKGDELITVGKTGLKVEMPHETITVAELKERFSELVDMYGKDGKMNAMLDFASPFVQKPYSSIGGAFVSLSDDDALMINLVHFNKPLDEKGQPIKLFILPSEDLKKKVTRKAAIKAMNLSYNEKGKIEKTTLNLLNILQNDPVITSAYKLDILRGVMCVHHLLHTDDTRPNNCLRFNESLGEQIMAFVRKEPFSFLHCEMMSSQDLTVLQAYIQQVYEISFDDMQMWVALNAAFSTSDKLDVKFNLLHQSFSKHYQDWVKDGKKPVLDTWLPDSLHVEKFINPEYYAHLSLVGRKLLIGICQRAYGFDNPIKLELMLAILGKAQNTGKSTMAETLVRSLLGVWGTESSVVGALDSRFILQTRQDEQKTGDQILSYAGKLIYLLEEFGMDQVGKKSANLLKTMISEKSITGRTPYSKEATTLNFTHFILSTTNDEKVLHQGDGDQRRFLIIDLDKKGNDGNFAIQLDGKVQAYNTNEGNRGFIDNKLMSQLLKQAWGEAYARAIHGDIDFGTSRELLEQRSARHTYTGQVISNVNIVCEMPRLSSAERKHIAAFNKEYEMRNDRIDDLLIKFFKDKSDIYSFSFDDIVSGIEEKTQVKNPAVVSNALKGLKYPLHKFTTKNRSVWCFVDAQGKALDENPYKNFDREAEEDDPVKLEKSQKAQEKALMEAQIEELKRLVEQKQAEISTWQEKATQAEMKSREVETKTELVILQSKPIDYGFTPELEEDDDDDDTVFEIVAKQSSGVVNVNIDHLTDNQVHKVNAMTQAIVEKQITEQIANAPKPIVIETPQVFDVHSPFKSPLDTLDLNNIDPRIMERFTKKVKKRS